MGKLGVSCGRSSGWEEASHRRGLPKGYFEDDQGGVLPSHCGRCQWRVRGKRVLLALKRCGEVQSVEEQPEGSESSGGAGILGVLPAKMPELRADEWAGGFRSGSGHLVRSREVQGEATQQGVERLR